MSLIVALRKEPNPSTLEELVRSTEFDSLVASLTKADDSSAASMTIAYLKEVSSMLAMVSAVGEGNIERHLQSERDMLKLVFSFNHQNYARYCSYQHVYLHSLQQQDHPAFQELKVKGIRGSITGGQ